MNKIRFCDANTGDLLRSINDPALPCIEVLRVTKARDVIITNYNNQVTTQINSHFIWNREVELVSSGNNFEWFGNRKSQSAAQLPS
jgi:hypothetical protein